MPASSVATPAISALGLLGQACFFSRFFVQWLASEKARRSVVPRSFWWLSLAGAGLMSVYSVHRGVPLLLFGFCVSGAIALRSLLRGDRLTGLSPYWSAAAALSVVGLSVWIELGLLATPGTDILPWLAFGALGQCLWMMRFPLQWWLSERAGHCHFPPAFWWVSLAGNGLLLAYALHLGDLVFVLGFLPGPFLQARNLALGQRSPQSG